MERKRETWRGNEKENEKYEEEIGENEKEQT